MAIALLLFLAALCAGGLTHYLLLNAGVCVVSVKLIMMAYMNSVSNESWKKKLDEIHLAVLQLQPSPPPDSGPK
jgi:hypothetical protein